MKKKDDLPAMPFYVGDWLKAPEVRAMPPDYRGLWFDCLCYMWESTERGYLLKPNGKPYSKSEIIRMIGLDNQNSELWLTYILENEVCSVRETDGAIYSRKMVKDEEVRKQRKIAGSKGGNPILVKGILNPQVKQFTEDETENEYEYEDIINSSKGGEGGNQNEDIQKLNVYWSANLFPPKIAHKEFVEELYKKFGTEKTKQIIKKFSEGNFRNLNTMKESLDENGNIKPRDQINRGNSGTKPDIIKSSGGTSNFDPSKSKYKIIGGAGGEPS